MSNIFKKPLKIDFGHEPPFILKGVRAAVDQIFELFKTPLKLMILILLASSKSAFAMELSWKGCGITKHAFMEEIARAYETKTGTNIKISGGGASKGIRSVSSNSGDLGGSCRVWLVMPGDEIHPHEKNAKLIPVAWDALVPVAHPDNPVNDISTDQIKKIFDGELKDWSSLGWNDSGKIILCTREGKESGVGFMLRKIIFKDSNHSFKGRSLKFKSSSSLEQKIEISPRSFGMTGVSSAQKRKLKILSINGVFPTRENIAKGVYSLFRPLFITVNKNDARPEVKMFLDFIKGPEGQKIISNQGTINWEEGKVLASKWKRNFPELNFQ